MTVRPFWILGAILGAIAIGEAIGADPLRALISAGAALCCWAIARIHEDA